MIRDDLHKWLRVSLNIKGWLASLVLAIAIMGLGFSFVLREIYAAAYTAMGVPDWASAPTLWFLPPWARGLVLLAAATSLALIASWKLNASLTRSLLPPSQQRRALLDLIYESQTRERGPRVVAIGGGTGLSNLLRGLKQHTVNLTAIVTVADDGGSSGRLRRDLHVIPPGDIRNCIAALAEAEPLMTQLFQYRFDERHGDGMSGHSFGNLFIAAMADVTGSMETAVSETSRVLAVRGEIIPASLEELTLVARWADGTVVRGESAISGPGMAPEEVWIEPPGPAAHPCAVQAIMEADLVVIGPGSLYTSLLPNLLVPQIARALLDTRAHRVFVANVATQHGETDGYSAADHYRALSRHLGSEHVADVVLANSNLPSSPLPERWRAEPVVAEMDDHYGAARLLLADVVDADHRYRHDAASLASALLRSYLDRRVDVGAAAVLSR